MRSRYETRGIVLARTFVGEANTIVTVLTPTLGLIHAHTQGVRRTGAKLAAALGTFTESDLIVVRGKESWRVAGAVLSENWFVRMGGAAARHRASRVGGLLLRLVTGETQDAILFSVLASFFEALSTLPEELHDAAEILAALRLIALLGLDAGDIPADPTIFVPSVLTEVGNNRSEYIARINRGIAASGL